MRASLAACLMFILAACDHQPASLTQQEKQIVTELTASLKTRCVGRYLIDMPGDAEASGYAKLQGVAFEAKAMSQDAYNQEIAQREAKLMATRSIDAYPFLYAAGEARGKGTRYFIYRGTVYDDPASRYIEAYKWDDGYRILLKIEGSDFTHPDQTNDSIVKKMAVKNDLPEKTSLVLGLLEKVRGRSEDDIPGEPGMCFFGGFLPGKASDHQFVSGGFALADRPDVLFDVSADTDPQDGTSLLQRAQQASGAIKEAGGTVMRKGAVNLTGIKAKEILIAGLTPAQVSGHSFSLEVNSTTSGPRTPFLSLDMYNGGVNQDPRDGRKIEKASLTEGEALALWDTVSRTLRMRPGAL